MAVYSKILAGVATAALCTGVYYNIKHEGIQDLVKNTGMVKYDVIHNTSLNNAIKKSEELVNIYKNEIGTPGLVIAVSVDGKTVWEEGFGYANVENQTPCNVSTVMRIASISKPITVALLAKLWEDSKVDLDVPVQTYVPYFPEKTFNKEKVKITTRQLACHMSGIRHYKKEESEDGKKSKSAGDSKYPEFYLKTKFNNLEKSIGLFKDDELLFKPGTLYNYTTHGYTLLSAVIEGSAKKPFTILIKELFKTLGLYNTYLDEISPLIPYRASYYTKDEKGRLINAELADTSYKWAGGGLVSSVKDLITFGNMMLYCYQQEHDDKPGYLKQNTVKQLWTIVDGTNMKWDVNAGYGLGWTVVPESESYGGVKKVQMCVGHGGGAVGASSILLIFPKHRSNYSKKPSGVVVAVLVNLEDVSCRLLAKNVAELFYNIEDI